MKMYPYLFPSLCYLLSGFWLSTQTCHFDLIRCLGHVDPSMEQPHAPEKLKRSKGYFKKPSKKSNHTILRKI